MNTDIIFSTMFAFDYSNIDFQNLDPVNCFSTCDTCDSCQDCDCNCDCDSDDCDCNDFCDNCDCDNY